MADQLFIQMVTVDTFRLVSPRGVPLDAHPTYHPFTPMLLISTTGSVRTVADVCNLIIEVHFSSYPENHANYCWKFHKLLSITLFFTTSIGAGLYPCLSWIRHCI